MGQEPVDPLADHVDRLLGLAPLERLRRRGLRAMEQDQAAVPLVRGDVVLIRPCRQTKSISASVWSASSSALSYFCSDSHETRRW